MMVNRSCHTPGKIWFALVAERGDALGLVGASRRSCRCPAPRSSPAHLRPQPHGSCTLAISAARGRRCRPAGGNARAAASGSSATSATKPSASARSAEIRRPNSAISLTTGSGSSRTSRCVPDQPGTMPTPASGRASVCPRRHHPDVAGRGQFQPAAKGIARSAPQSSVWPAAPAGRTSGARRAPRCRANSQRRNGRPGVDIRPGAEDALTRRRSG